MYRKYIIGASTFLLALSPGCQSGPEKSESENKRGNALEVDYVVAEAQPIVNSIEVTGSLIPAESAQLTTQASGKVQSIHFEEGEMVKKGQLLVKIDAREWQAQLERFQAELETAKKDLQRKKALAEVNGVTDAELEAAQLRVQNLEANIRESRVKIDHASIRAPFAGKIGLRNISQGSYINSGAPVAMLVQENPIKLEFSVPERFAAQVKPGQQVHFSIPNTDEKRVARVYATEPMISESTRALKVRAKAENPAGELIPGSFADINLSLDSIPDAIMIPTEAIIPQLNNQLVYRMSNGIAEEVKVKTGVRQPRKVQVSSGIEVGDSVMVTGLLQVRPGMSVKAGKQVDVEQFEDEE